MVLMPLRVWAEPEGVLELVRRPMTFIVKVVAAWSKWGRSPEVTLGKPHAVTPVQH